MIPYSPEAVKASSSSTYKTFLLPLFVPPNFATIPDVLLPAPGFSREVSVRVTNTAGDSRGLTLKVYLGGVSKRMLRHLHEQNKSIFLLKLMNPEANFFLTTRTSGKLITLRETEIHPLSFIYPDGGVLKVVAGGVTTTLVGVAGQPYALNLYRLRAKLFAENHVLASVFDIMIGDTKSCTIVLTPAASAASATCSSS